MDVRLESAMDDRFGGFLSSDPRRDMRVYDVDGFLFRIDAFRADSCAEVLRDGEWRQFCLTGDDVRNMLYARELSSEEAERIELAA